MPSETIQSARRPGRPAKQAASKDQRERLLDIALELFARQGVADTTLSAIARKAGMTPAMAHYYFKTREQLFDVLIDERIMPARTDIEAIFKEHAADPMRALTLFVERLVATHVRLPWFGALWIREMISDNDIFKQHMRKRFGAEQQAAKFDAVRRWQREGKLNPQIEPALLFVSLLGLTTLPMVAVRRWQGDPLVAHIDAQVIARHAVALLTQGVGPGLAGAQGI
ncbi:TetR/AcrR family transcriptional regulator [Dyella halodurans]|uniref:TetR/AcrR family transcriptional regulator n=1 Tax=Dyella halodurans TaxID=1920171 RepID=A0ABV9C6H2_9GAMM|nr:TetR/AcrR family transcriptional regulator [Dyella halodurans]